MAKRPLIYFSRHGQTDWNVERRIQGQYDQDINAIGRQQAARNGQLLKQLIGEGEGFDFVASPLRRTRETMEIIRREMGLDIHDYRVDKNLMEMHFGDWQTYTEAEIAKKFPEEIAGRQADKWHFTPMGKDAESYATLAKRIHKWVENVKGNTVCVTHGGCLRSIMHIYGGLSKDDAANLFIEQDQILRFDDRGLAWL